MRALLGLAMVLGLAQGAWAETTGPLSTYLVTPCRFLDTRDEQWYWYEFIFGPLDSRYHFFRVQGTCQVPVGAEGVLVNVTATEATDEGFLTLFNPGGEGRPGFIPLPPTSNLNFAPGRTVANFAVVKIAPSDRYDASDLGLYILMPSGTVHVVLDVVGYLK